MDKDQETFSSQISSAFSTKWFGDSLIYGLNVGYLFCTATMEVSFVDTIWKQISK